MPAPADYPDELTEVALLEDGTAVVVRAIRPDDAARLEEMFHRLSAESIYRRFATPVTRPDPAMVARLVTVDYHDRLALVAEIDGEVVGVARYDRLAPRPGQLDEAEAALIVEDAWQGRGLGTRLLWRLTAAARERGVQAFVAVVLGENRPMMGLLRVLAEDVEVTFTGGEYEIRILLARVPDGPPR